MNKKQLYNNIMRNINEALDPTFDSMEDPNVDVEVYANDKKVEPAYIVECNVTDSMVIKEVQSITHVKSSQSRKNVKFMCNGMPEVCMVLRILDKQHVFEMPALLGSFGTVKIYKFGDAMNDSLQEKKVNEAIGFGDDIDPDEDIVTEYEPDEAVQGPNNSMKGVYETDFIYNVADDEATGGKNATEEGALRNYTLWLKKNKIQFEMIPSRFSNKIRVYWNDKDEFAKVVQWAAFDMGYTDAPSAKPNKKDLAEIEDAVIANNAKVF